MKGKKTKRIILQAFNVSLKDYLEKQPTLSTREQRELGTIRKTTLKYKHTPNSAQFQRIKDKKKQKKPTVKEC